MGKLEVVDGPLPPTRHQEPNHKDKYMDKKWLYKESINALVLYVDGNPRAAICKIRDLWGSGKITFLKQHIEETLQLEGKLDGTLTV
jgi:hypothetical protein